MPTATGQQSRIGPDGISGDLCPTKNDLTWNAGFTIVRPTKAPRVTIRASLWYDNNLDGIRNTGDTGARGYEVYSSDVTTQKLAITAPATGPDGTTGIGFDFLGFDQGEVCNNVRFAPIAGNSPGDPRFPYEPDGISSYSPPLFPNTLHPNLRFTRISNAGITVCLEGAPATGRPTITIPRGQDLTVNFDIGLNVRDPWL
ncbi:MAG: hypothetical protein R2698_04045 [Microthrixaceae bacterium]